MLVDMMPLVCDHHLQGLAHPLAVANVMMVVILHMILMMINSPNTDYDIFGLINNMLTLFSFLLQYIRMFVKPCMMFTAALIFNVPFCDIAMIHTSPSSSSSFCCKHDAAVAAAEVDTIGSVDVEVCRLMTMILVLRLIHYYLMVPLRILLMMRMVPLLLLPGGA
jgi:hypothetical protein